MTENMRETLQWLRDHGFIVKGNPTMLWLQIEYVNVDKGYRFGSEPWHETRYESTERADLFRALQREYGRCVSTMYRDPDRKVGWVFQKKMEYDDNRPGKHDTYTREVWVEVSERTTTGDDNV